MEEFKPAAINRVSNACTAICLWVRAMHKYYVVRKHVEPKRRAAAQAAAAYEVSKLPVFICARLLVCLLDYRLPQPLIT